MEITINKIKVEVREGETIMEAAHRIGIVISIVYYFSVSGTFFMAW